MAYNFNDDPARAPGPDPQAPAGTVPPEDAPDRTSAPTDEAAPAASQSVGVARFNSCRWQQPKEDGNAAFCTHREVKPYAGTTEFDADAWCPECQYYKLRRAPKKRNPHDDYGY